MARPERKRIFVGCEGESESGYNACVASLARDRGLPVTVDPHVMKRGDPLARIQWAVKKIAQQEEARGEYAHKFAFLDMDQREREPERTALAMALATEHGIEIIWQVPDHEGLLLLHFDNNEKHRPRTKDESMHAVRKVWPSYEKNSTGQQYRRKIGPDELLRAGNLHAKLRVFLETFGLLEPVEPKPERPRP